MPSPARTRFSLVNVSLWLCTALGCLFGCGPFSVQAQSGDAFVEAVVSHLKITPYLVETLNVTSYPYSFYVQDSIELVNVSVINLLNLHREGPWDLLVDSDGLMHLRGALNLSDVYVRAGYRYHRWFTTLNGHIRLHFPQLKLELHTTLANLTSLELIGFRVASIIPPQVVEFSGATTLFNWIGARRVQNLMDASTSILVENFENFVRTSVTAVMQSKKYSSQRCQQQSEQNQQRNQPQDHQQQRHQDPSIENWGTTANWTDLSNGTEDTLLTRQ